MQNHLTEPWLLFVSDCWCPSLVKYITKKQQKAIKFFGKMQITFWKIAIYLQTKVKKRCGDDQVIMSLWEPTKHPNKPVQVQIKHLYHAFCIISARLDNSFGYSPESNKTDNIMLIISSGHARQMTKVVGSCVQAIGGGEIHSSTDWLRLFTVLSPSYDSLVDII